MGRPTKLTPEVQARIVKAIAAGNYPEIAAESEGVGKTAYYGWMERGRKGESPYAEFAEAVTRARARAERKMVRIVRTAAITEPQSAQWYLERSAADRWGRRDKVTVENAVRDELAQALAKLDHGIQLAPNLAHHRGRDAAGREFELAASVGQADAHASLIRVVALTRDQPRALKALEQRGQGAGVQLQQLSEFMHGAVVALPEHEHHQVLRIGQAQWRKQRLVQLGHGQRCGIQRKADLVVQPQGGGAGAVFGGGRAGHGLNYCVQLNCVRFN